MNENPINTRISVADSFLINFNNVDSSTHNTTKEYKSRNNIETIVMICNWLIESHESLGTDHGFLRTKEEEVGERDSISIISKLNIIINLMSESLSNEDEDDLLTNVRFNSIGILPDINCEWGDEGTLEIIISSAVRKKILIKCSKINTIDGAVWKFIDLSYNELELLDKMVFLLHRNNHHQRHSESGS